MVDDVLRVGEISESRMQVLEAARLGKRAKSAKEMGKSRGNHVLTVCHIRSPENGKSETKS